MQKFRILTYLTELPKFNYDRLRNGNVLGIWKFDNNNTNKNNVSSRWEPLPLPRVQKYPPFGNSVYESVCQKQL